MKLPKDVRGIHVFCSKCRKVVTSSKSKCGKKGVLARNCDYKDKHKYQSRIRLGNSFKVRTWHTTDLIDVVKNHQDFRASIQTMDVQKPRKPFPKYLADCMALYLDWLQDIGLPAHEQKNLSKQHVLSQARYLKRFLNSSASRTTPIDVISSEHVGRFHTFLQGYARRTYNHHIQGLQTFFDFLIQLAMN